IASTGASDALVSVSGTAQGEGTTALIYYWHFNNLNTSSGDVTEIEADFSLISGKQGHLTYTGGVAGDRDIDEFSPGSSLNLQMGEAEGNAARVRNPSEDRSLVFDLPTDGCTNLVFEYALHRSNNGMLNNIIEYSTDGTTFI